MGNPNSGKRTMFFQNKKIKELEERIKHLETCNTAMIDILGNINFVIKGLVADYTKTYTKPQEYPNTPNGA